MSKKFTCGYTGFISKIYYFFYRDLPSFECCCVAHDEGYKKGGTEEDRVKLDKKFMECMEVRSNTIVGWAFHKAVRIGGRFSFNYK